MSKNANSEKQALFNFCLRLGDSSLILGHRLSEWCGHGPILEEDIAMTNISLDLIGQARMILTYAGSIEAKGKSEDDLAYYRDAREYKNALLVEYPNGDFAFTMTRQFLYSTFQYFLFDELKSSKDKTIAAIAEKSWKEVSYHLRHSAEWMLRLGAGTEESNQRSQAAVNDLWMLTGDLFETDEADSILFEKGISADMKKIKKLWEEKVFETLRKATLIIPDKVWMLGGSKDGNHTEHLGFLLAEMQFLPRAYPGTSW